MSSSFKFPNTPPGVTNTSCSQDYYTILKVFFVGMLGKLTSELTSITPGENVTYGHAQASFDLIGSSSFT